MKPLRQRMRERGGARVRMAAGEKEWEPDAVWVEARDVEEAEGWEWEADAKEEEEALPAARTLPVPAP